MLTYVGTYYPHSQDLGTILTAFGDLKQEGQLPRCRLQIVGDFPYELAHLIEETRLGASVEWTGFVSHEESIRRILASRALLLAGSVVSDEPALRGHIPGKTFEYLGSGKPIVFAGDLASDVAQLLRPFPQARMVGLRRCRRRSGRAAVARRGFPCARRRCIGAVHAPLSQ